MTVDVDRPLPLCADGDEIATLPAAVSIRAGALKIIAPG